MDFQLDNEQTALRDAVRSLLKDRYSVEQRQEIVASEPGWDAKLWTQLAEMGLLGLPFAEDDGGMGAGPIEVMVVAQELGRSLAPAPWKSVV